jgi:hypothetical protein
MTNETLEKILIRRLEGGAAIEATPEFSSELDTQFQNKNANCPRPRQSDTPEADK